MFMYRKQYFFRILLLPLTLSILFSLPSLAYNGNVTVYVTDTGEKYHRDQCTYLSSAIPITLEKAVNTGYERCSRCDPPILGEDSPYDSTPYIPPENEPTSRGHPKGEVLEGDPPEKAPKKDNTLTWILCGVLLCFASSIIIVLFVLPKTLNQPDIVYVAKRGKVYHRTQNCTKGATIPIRRSAAKGYKPCKKCYKHQGALQDPGTKPPKEPYHLSVRDKDGTTKTVYAKDPDDLAAKIEEREQSKDLADGFSIFDEE